MIYEFQATQDLHGYDKPWAPGMGNNLFDGVFETGGYDDSTGADVGSSASTQRTKNGIVVTGSTEYYFIAVPKVSGNPSVLLCEYDENGDFLGSTYKYLWGFSITTKAATTLLKFRIYNVNITAEADIGQVAFNYPSTVTTYVPYSNICPPEGFNIWDPTNQEYVQVYAGFVNSNTRELYLRPVYQEYAGEELVGPWMSSLDLYAEDTTPTEGAFVIDFGGELTSFEITPFMLQTLLDSLGIRQHFTDGAGLLNSLMDQAQGRVRSEEELLHLSRPLRVIPIGDQLPAGLTFKPISKDVLPGLPGKFIR